MSAGRASRSCPTTSMSFFKIKELWTRHDKGKTAFYFFVEQKGIGPSLIELDGDELWRFGFSTGQKPVTAEQANISGLIEKFLGPHIPYEQISVLPWTCRSIVAETWRRGNVFLAGDAVHQHSPSGGFGIANTGLGDAVNLAWKLAAALDGWAARALIDSYELERKPVARRIAHRGDGRAGAARRCIGACADQCGGLRRR